MRDGPLLLYDGLCGFCNGTVQFVLAHDRRGTVRFASLQGPTARQVLARHPELVGIDSLVLVERDPKTGVEMVSARSTGALRLAGHLGGPWVFARVFAIVPRFLRDWVYDLFARFRYRIFGRYETCPVPSPGERERFFE